MIISIATGPWLPVPAIQGGAVNRRWQGVAEEFAVRGHQVRILCRAHPDQPQTEVIKGVQYIRRGGFAQSTNIAFDLVKDFIYAVSTVPTLPPADVLVTNDFWLPVFVPLHPTSGKVVVNAARAPKGQYFLYSGVDRIVGVSKAVQNAIIQQNPRMASRVTSIPNPINTEIFTPSRLPKPEREEKVILYAGRIHPEKGLHLLIDAFTVLAQKFPTIKLRIIGPYQEHQGGGGQSYLQQLKLKAQNLNVEFLEPTFDPHQLANFYRDADLFCYPSLAERGEAFGVAPLEAMATGLVPIVSNLDCFRDFIIEGVSGYFFDHRSNQAISNLAKSLETVLKNWQQTCNLAKNASCLAQEFSYSRTAESYLEEFEKLLISETSVSMKISKEAPKRSLKRN
ncbi:glycosyltransferase family 4 protein [Leptolyngbya sp. 7M]|uniref:glycosyltransferase family 4 protein n=1 Tax=Leptolyngbya sp. 7M TaxID=2812896 RepID=UPI001B8C15A8|nr:glycosyltransferase family 4 protein [Leptolyngbya sp. 7M]QYO62224.1 glycosyltransferase family 4 protein [Leptolyngbya sp. 7M]